MDDTKIFIADPDGIASEEWIDENSYILLSDEEEEDYPSDEEIAEVMAEIYKDEQ